MEDCDARGVIGETGGWDVVFYFVVEGLCAGDGLGEDYEGGAEEGFGGWWWSD